MRKEIDCGRPTMRKPGRKPYGYRVKEREIIERIVRKRRPRKGGLVVRYRQIAQELNDEGYHHKEHKDPKEYGLKTCSGSNHGGT